MRRVDMNRVVHHELQHIPRGSLRQNELRMVYALERRHDLAADPTTTAAATFARALASVRRREPTFIPAYDAALLTQPTASTAR